MKNRKMDQGALLRRQQERQREREREQEGQEDISWTERITKGQLCTVLAILAVAGIGSGTYAKLKGFNDGPRGPKHGIEFIDPNYDLELKCLRDLFHDKATDAFPKNRWMHANCPMGEMDWLTGQEDPLNAIVKVREMLFKRAGIPPKTETWIQSVTGDDSFHGIDVDTEKAAKAAEAGRIKAYSRHYSYH